MLSSLTTKIALKKVGLPSDTFDLSSWTLPSSPSTDPRREPNKLRKRPPPPRPEGYEDNDGENSWGSWVSGISIPLTVHPWLTPPPPPIRVAGVPTVGDAAPVDREGRLKLGGGQRTLVVFLRCVGCACRSFHHDALGALLIRLAPTIHVLTFQSPSSRSKHLPHPTNHRKPLPRHDPLRRRLPLLPASHPQMDRPPRRRLGRRRRHRRGPRPLRRVGARPRQRLVPLPPSSANSGLEGEGLAGRAGGRRHTKGAA